MIAHEHDKETATWLLNLANDMRKAQNDALLTDLPRSHRREPSSCIIANAFNYGCTVEPGNGTITFRCEEDRNIYLKVMGFHWSPYSPEDDEWCDYEEGFEPSIVVENFGEYYEFNAPMTDQLVEIAENFDEGLLFEEYAE